MYQLLPNREIYLQLIQQHAPQARRYLWIITADIKDIHVEFGKKFGPFLELFERILCPRVHTKAVIIDGRMAFAGSANLTGAGMGAKSIHKRNFEAGLLFDDTEMIRELTDWVDALYLGEFCHECKRREFCPDPIIDRY